MQTIYGDASNINLTAQKRLIRVVYSQTSATPYAGVLDPSLREANGNIRTPKAADTEPLKRSKDAFTYLNGLVPGTVLVKTTGEALAVAAGAATERPFGLLDQWVGGTFDNIKSTNQISAWVGPDSVYDILYPGFNAENDDKVTIQTLVAAQNANPGIAKNVVVVVASANGLLEAVTEEDALEDKTQEIFGEVISLTPSTGTGSVLRVKSRV